MTENPIDQKDATDGEPSRDHPPKQTPALDFIKGAVITVSVAFVQCLGIVGLKDDLHRLASSQTEILVLYLFGLLLLFFGFCGFCVIILIKGKFWTAAGVFFTLVTLFTMCFLNVLMHEIYH